MKKEINTNESIDTQRDQDSHHRLVLRLRPRWERVLMWPLNFLKIFRIGSYRPMRLRAKVAFDVANGIVRLDVQNDQEQL